MYITSAARRIRKTILYPKSLWKYRASQHYLLSIIQLLFWLFGVDLVIRAECSSSMNDPLLNQKCAMIMMSTENLKYNLLESYTEYCSSYQGESMTEDLPFFMPPPPPPPPLNSKKQEQRSKMANPHKPPMGAHTVKSQDRSSRPENHSPVIRQDAMRR